MAGYIPEHKIDEVRQAADIVQVISSYVALTKAGRLFRGLCPFHAEKTPSFTVNPERRIFHCFGCGVGGNVFRFLMLHKGISFPEAVAELAERCGIDLPRTDKISGPQARQGRAALYRALGLAQDFYEEELQASSGRTAREYLARRGINPDIIGEFHLGWAPPGWDNLRLFLESKAVPVEVMEKAGLVRPRGQGRGFYDTFRARIICPILDLDGKTAAFGGRLLQEEENQPKYLNSPETPVYSKGRLLYGWHQNQAWFKQQKTALVVEGYFDLLSLAARGVRPVVATLGTALTAAHLRILKGYVQDTILFFDADEAGKKAAARSLPLFMAAELDGRVLRLPEGHDPDTFVREYGAPRVWQALKETVGLVDFYLDQTVRGHPDTPAGRAGAVREVLSVINQVENPTSRELLRRALAERLGVSEESLVLAERRQEVEKEDRYGIVEGVAADIETQLIRLVLLHPETAPEILNAGLGPHFAVPGTRRIYEVMIGLFDRFGRVEVERLVEEVEPEAAGLITGLASAEDGLGPEDLDAAVGDFINRFADRTRRQKAQDLSRRIKQAQEIGDEERLTILLQEKNQLLKEKVY
ncbi:MAG: DNA primase [Pseudomonadota bacterium]